MSQDKFCTNCGETKDAKDFSVDRSNPDGLTSYCKACNVSNKHKWLAEENKKVSKKVREALENRSMGTREAISLWHLVQDLKDGHFLVPPHQREDSWSLAKKREYITYLYQDSTPPGSLEVYQLEKPGKKLSPKYLNEGNQRARTAEHALKYPAKYGCTKEEIEYILKNTSYPYTLVKHKSHEEALLRFQISNSNIPLTPYQMAIGDIIYCEGDTKYKDWQNLVNNLHKAVFNSFEGISKLCPSTKGKTYLVRLHKIYRFNLAAFYRFLSKDKSLANLRFEKELNPFEKQYCEVKLSSMLKSMGYAQACLEVERFERFLQRHAKLLEACWRDTLHKSGFITQANCQWLVLLFLWADKHPSITKPLLADFIDEFLRGTDGKTHFVYVSKDGDPKQVMISQGKLTVLSLLVKDGICKTDLLKIAQEKRRKREPLPPGLHHSHVKPFGLHGEGETIVEPAALNLSRGMQEIEVTGQ